MSSSSEPSEPNPIHHIIRSIIAGGDFGTDFYEPPSARHNEIEQHKISRISLKSTQQHNKLKTHNIQTYLISKTMTAITVELIDALLNPSKGRTAEDQFKSINLPTRVHGLFSLLIHTISPQDVPRCMLACVLLRRDISSLGAYTCVQGHIDQAREIAAMLGAMVDPLLAFLGQMYQDQDQDAQTRRQLGFVVAEVCSTLSLLDDDLAQASVNNVLNSISSSCSMANKPSLDLLSTLALRAPFALASTSTHSQALPMLLQNAANALPGTGLPIQSQLQCANSILEAMTNISIAFTIAQKSSSTAPLSSNPKERMVQMIQLQTMNEINTKKLTIDINSPAAMIGKMCLCPILQLIFANPTRTSSSGGVQTIMQTISQCASTSPSLLAGDVDTFTSVCQVLLTVASRAEEEARLSAVEALVTLIAVPGVKQIMNANTSVLHLCIEGDEANGIQGVVKVCAEMIVNGVDDDVDFWAQEKVALQEDAAQWENDDNAIFAESILESFLQNVGGSKCLSAVLSLVESLLSSNQWQQLRAGLSILGICLTSAPYSFAAHVPVAVEAALSFSSNPCVRVQFQAVQLLGALCRSDVIGDGASSGRPQLEIRKQHGNRILAAFGQLLDSCPKVVGHVCLAIVSYCRGGNGKENAGMSIDKALVLPFMGEILTRIGNGPLSLNVADNVDVFIRAFAAIACLADVSMGEFAPFYNSVMPGLLECASYGLERDANNNITGRGTSAEEIVSLRGGSIEAATIVGQAVGASQGMFHVDAEKLMQLVLPLLEVQAVDEATTMIPQDQLLAASARIACVMEAAYAPFIPRVLPHMLKKASEKADVSITDGDESTVGQESGFDEDTGMESITISLPGLGVKKMVLNTTQMQEKAQVARAIYEHANSMGATFGPYARECIEAFAPLITFQYAADVRSTAAQALGPVFDSACEYALTLHSSDSRVNLPKEVFSPILLAMAKQLVEEEEDDIETLCAFSEAMSNIAYSGFSHVNENVRACMTCGEANQFVTLLVKTIEKCLERRYSMIQMVLGGALDEDSKVEYEDILSAESEFLTGLIDSIGYTLKSLREEFMPVFDSIVAPFFGPLLKASGTIDSRARFGAVCLFDDCIEHCGSSCTKYAPTLANAVQEGINDDDLEVREASVYGISQIVRKATKESLQAYAEPLVQRLAAIARDGTGKVKDEIEDIRLVENSSSALATMTLFNSSPFKNTRSVPRTELLDIFISNLPLQEDFDEAKVRISSDCNSK